MVERDEHSRRWVWVAVLWLATVCIGCDSLDPLDEYIERDCTERTVVTVFDRALQDSSLTMTPATVQVKQTMVYNPGNDCAAMDQATTEVAFTNLLEGPQISFAFEATFERYSVRWNYEGELNDLGPGETSSPIVVSTLPALLIEENVTVRFVQLPPYDGRPKVSYEGGPKVGEYLLGVWSGTYSWTCGDGGETRVRITIDNLRDDAFNGRILYLDLQGASRLTGEDGFVTTMDVQQSDDVAGNYFWGKVEGSTMRGSTSRGDTWYGFAGSRYGCTGWGGPGGSFLLHKE